MKKSISTKKMVAMVAAFAVMCNMSFASTNVFAADDDYSDEVVEEVSDDSVEEYTDEDYMDEEMDEDTGVSLTTKKLNLKIGKSAYIDIDGDYDSVVWTSSKKSVARVNSDGKVTAVKAGTATITADVTCIIYNEDDAVASDEYDYYEEAASDESEVDDATVEEAGDWDEEDPGEEVNYTLTCKVTVGKSGAVKLSAEKLTLKAGKSKVLKVQNATGKVNWTSKKKAVATVTNGKVKAVKKGKAVILAKVGKTVLRCSVTVK